jgi:GT2 family glycosyltransferase
MNSPPAGPEHSLISPAVRERCSLSVVIPSHNRPDLLRACLSTVARYAPGATQIIVVDDGSPGASVSRAAVEFPGVTVVRCSRRRGFCAAANAGIESAAGEVVELLNDDTEVTPGWADVALPHFQDATVGAVAPLVLQPSPSGPRVDSAGDRYYLGGVAAKRGHGRPLTPDLMVGGRVFGASGSSAFYRREAILRVGAFPSSFGAYFEDVDLAFRLNRAGYGTVFEPTSRVWHHVSASYGRPRRKLLEQQSRNEERVFWRNVPSGALARALPKHAAVLAGKALRRWREGTVSPFFWGRLRLLGEVRELVRHRRVLGPAGDLRAWSVEDQYWS